MLLSTLILLRCWCSCCVSHFLLFLLCFIFFREETENEKKWGKMRKKISTQAKLWVHYSAMKRGSTMPSASEKNHHRRTWRRDREELLSYHSFSVVFSFAVRRRQWRRIDKNYSKYRRKKVKRANYSEKRSCFLLPDSVNLLLSLWSLFFAISFLLSVHSPCFRALRKVDDIKMALKMGSIVSPSSHFPFRCSLQNFTNEKRKRISEKV